MSFYFAYTQRKQLIVDIAHMYILFDSIKRIYFVYPLIISIIQSNLCKAVPLALFLFIYPLLNPEVNASQFAVFARLSHNFSLSFLHIFD